MAINIHNRVKADFNSSSMSDLVFLLLIFFMITSTLVAPNAINILLPKSDSGKQLASRNIEVYINEKNEYFVNPKGPNDVPISYENLLPMLQTLATSDNSDQRCVILRADKTVAVEYVVALMDVLNMLNDGLAEGNKYKIVMAVEPK